MIKLIKQAFFLTMSLLFTPMLVAEPLSPNELHATMGIVTNFILDDDIQFHGKSYKPVTSPHTGRVWLDRNIGASKKCTSYDYPLCYGDLFQWGRAYDGHESSVDSTTVLAYPFSNAGAEFIRGAIDWGAGINYGSARATNWLKADGSSVCPVGYRVPLRSELDAEVGDISNKETAYINFLKFPAAGYRHYADGNYYDIGTLGAVWSVATTLSRASYFRFYSVSNWNDSGERAYGLSVRCIKHEGKPLIYHNTTTYSTVTSPYTGKVWLDRNLGASQVCTVVDDPACYGDYYQWGRNYDGHQDSASGVNTVLATNVNYVGHTLFITNTTDPFDWASSDDAGTTRVANWSTIDGFSVCPIGFRVPTITELRAETVDEDVSNAATAFSNFLKLPSAGERIGNSAFAPMNQLGSTGNIWTGTTAGSISAYIHFDSTSAYVFGYGNRSAGLSLRCVKN